MKMCHKCGAGIPDAATLCPICNTEIESSQNERSYAGYYDDVEPEDSSEKAKRKVDSGIALKIALVAFGLVVAVAVCITVLYLV